MRWPGRRARRTFQTVVALLLACGGIGVAQSAMPMANAAAVPPAQLPPPVHMEGIGASSMAITTASPEARVWFEQGLNLLHDFWDYESERAFEQSVRLDPRCAMCWWGVYQAESFRGDHAEWATEALVQAKKLKRHASPAERLYIQAALADDKEHRENKPPKKRRDEPDKLPHLDSRATGLLRRLVRLEPGDTQARLFLAESLIDGFGADGKPRAGTREAQAMLAELLREHPDDAAANHYWIHAVEPGNHPELALSSARKLAALAPASGHMVHMPGHIFYRTGDYEQARLAFLASMHVDESYMQAQHVSVDNDWNYVHNLMYLVADLLEAGRLREAVAVSGKLHAARGESQATLYRFSTRDGMTRLSPDLPVALRSADWTRATRLLEASQPAADLPYLLLLRSTLLGYTRGMAAIERGDIPAAVRDRDAMEANLGKLPAGDGMRPMPGTGSSRDAMPGPLHSFLDVAMDELRGAVYMAQRRSSEADAAFARAQTAEVALGYREPPYSIRPVAETRGDALLRARRYQEARAAYELALRERPNSGYSLIGIARADRGMHDSAAATTAYSRFIDAWAHADSDLPQLSEARAYLAAQTAEARLR